MLLFAGNIKYLRENSKRDLKTITKTAGQNKHTKTTIKRSFISVFQWFIVIFV